jgi:hypothetical protein
LIEAAVLVEDSVAAAAAVSVAVARQGGGK